MNVAMLAMGTAPGCGRLELLEATSDSSPIAQFVGKSGPGLHHLALRVDNLEEAIDQLSQQGFEVIGEPQKGAGDYRFVFVHPRSTGGVLLELLQREPL